MRLHAHNACKYEGQIQKAEPSSEVHFAVICSLDATGHEKPAAARLQLHGGNDRNRDKQKLSAKTDNGLSA
jgi:hypothetical protein